MRGRGAAALDDRFVNRWAVQCSGTRQSSGSARAEVWRLPLRTTAQGLLKRPSSRSSQRPKGPSPVSAGNPDSVPETSVIGAGRVPRRRTPDSTCNCFPDRILRLIRESLPAHGMQLAVSRAGSSPAPSPGGASRSLTPVAPPFAQVAHAHRPKRSRRAHLGAFFLRIPVPAAGCDAGGRGRPDRRLGPRRFWSSAAEDGTA